MHFVERPCNVLDLKMTLDKNDIKLSRLLKTDQNSDRVKAITELGIVRDIRAM